ncbi:MAG: hypothetical protein CMH59_13470 [Myxococcales bacterium]|nr:hypothetical protein [Myxococcales bacterium]
MRRWMVVAALGLGACAIPIEDEVGSQAQALRELDDVEAEFLMHMNEHRAMNGEAPVVDDFALNEGARDYSQVMGERNHFDHTGPDGSHFAERMCDSGYDPACGPSTFVGENIAAGNADAWSTFEQWRNSPGHNRNMLDGRYRVVGIGRAEVAGSRYRVYWTNTFAGQVTDTANEGEPPPEPMDPPEDPMDPPEDPMDPGTDPGLDGGSTTIRGGCSAAGGAAAGLWPLMAVGLLARRRR